MEGVAGLGREDYRGVSGGRERMGTCVWNKALWPILERVVYILMSDRQCSFLSGSGDAN